MARLPLGLPAFSSGGEGDCEQESGTHAAIRLRLRDTDPSMAMLCRALLMGSILERWSIYRFRFCVDKVGFSGPARTLALEIIQKFCVCFSSACLFLAFLSFSRLLLLLPACFARFSGSVLGKFSVVDCFLLIHMNEQVSEQRREDNSVRRTGKAGPSSSCSKNAESFDEASFDFVLSMAKLR